MRSVADVCIRSGRSGAIVHFGSFVGNGQESQRVALPYTIQALIITNPGGQLYGSTPGLYSIGTPSIPGYPSAITIDRNGFTVSRQINEANSTYNFLAIEEE